jgi:hypothetical protein
MCCLLDYLLQHAVLFQCLLEMKNIFTSTHNYILRFQILMVTSMKQSVIFTQIHDIRIPCVQLHKMYMNTVKIYAYIYIYMGLYGYPPPSQTSPPKYQVLGVFFPRPPFFIAAVMPSRHDRLGRPLFLLPVCIHEWIMAGHLSSGILITWKSISLILFSTHRVKK